jgi:hypothetical protein
MPEPLPSTTLAWLRQSAAVDGAAYSQVLLHLLERVEALEQRPTCKQSLQVPPAAPPAPEPVAPVSDSKMSDYNHRAAARFAILDRLEKAIDFNSHGWRLTPEGERWTRLMAEQGQDECEMGL